MNGACLRMKQSDIPNAVFEFERGENWKRPPGEKRKNWRTIVRDDLKKIGLPNRHWRIAKSNGFKWGVQVQFKRIIKQHHESLEKVRLHEKRSAIDCPPGFNFLSCFWERKFNWSDEKKSIRLETVFTMDRIKRVE